MNSRQKIAKISVVRVLVAYQKQHHNTPPKHDSCFLSVFNCLFFCSLNINCGKNHQMILLDLGKWRECCTKAFPKIDGQLDWPEAASVESWLHIAPPARKVLNVIVDEFRMSGDETQWNIFIENRLMG